MSQPQTAQDLKKAIDALPDGQTVYIKAQHLAEVGVKTAGVAGDKPVAIKVAELRAALSKPAIPEPKK
jgi:hypothetical protein